MCEYTQVHIYIQILLSRYTNLQLYVQSALRVEHREHLCELDSKHMCVWGAVLYLQTVVVKWEGRVLCPLRASCPLFHSPALVSGWATTGEAWDQAGGEMVL